MRASSPRFSVLHRAHTNLLNSIVAANHLQCTCKSPSRSSANPSSSATSRSSHSTSSNPLSSTSPDYNLDFLYPQSTRRLYSTRQSLQDDENAAEEGRREDPQPSPSPSPSPSTSSTLQDSQGKKASDVPEKTPDCLSSKQRSSRPSKPKPRDKGSRGNRTNQNHQAPDRNQQLNHPDPELRSKRSTPYPQENEFDNPVSFLMSLISYPTTTDNFPIPTHSSAPELALLFNHEDNIYKAYKEAIATSSSKSNSNLSIDQNFQVARYLLRFDHFIGSHFSRIQLRKAEHLGTRCATIILDHLIPQLELLIPPELEGNDPGSSEKGTLDSLNLKDAKELKFMIECLRVEALITKRQELEALELLDSLLESRDILNQVDEVSNSSTSLGSAPKAVVALSRSVQTVLSNYKLAAQFPFRERRKGTNYTGRYWQNDDRAIDAIDPAPESIANQKSSTRPSERALSWFFSRPELCIFDRQPFKEIHRNVRYLVSELREPLPFLKTLHQINLTPSQKSSSLEKPNRKARSENIITGMTSFTMSLIQVDLSQAFRCWKFISSMGLPLAEEGTRRLIEAASLNTSNSTFPQLSMVESLHNLAVKQKPGSGLELSTYTTLCQHCAKFGNQVGLEHQIKQIRLYHGEELNDLTDAFYKWRCLAASVAGDLDRLLRLLNQRFVLDQILPRKEASRLELLKQDLDREEFPVSEKTMIDEKSKSILRCYVKQGDVESAQEVFENMKSLNLRISPRTYDLLLTGHSKKGNVPASLSLVDEMRSQGMKLSHASYNNLIRLFALRKDPESAERVIETMEREGLKVDMRTHVALLNTYVESGSWDLAVSHFDYLELKYKGSPSSKDYRRNKLPTQAYNILLKAYILSASPIQVVVETFQRLMSDGFQPDSHSFTLLLQSAADAGAMDVAETIFSIAEEHLARDERVGMSSQKSLKIDESGDVLSDPLEEDLGKAGFREDEEAEESFIPEADDLLSSDPIPDEGGFDHAETSLHESRRPIIRGQGANVYHFTVMINAYLRLGDSETAKQYLSEMRKRGIKLTSVTYGSLVASYVKNETENNAALAKELISNLKSFQVDSSDSETLAEGSQSDLDSRISLEQKILDPNASESSSWDSTDFETLYSPLLQSYAKAGEVSKAQDVLRDMSEIGIKGSIRTLTTFLDANRRAGDVEACMDVWETIYSRALAETSFDTNINSNPTDQGEAVASPSKPLDPSRKNLLCLPLSIYMDMLQDDDYYRDEIPKVWTQMRKDGFGFDAHNYNSLVRALIKSDRIENAMRICEEILKDDLYEDAKERKLLALNDEKIKRDERRLRAGSEKGTSEKNQAEEAGALSDGVESTEGLEVGQEETKDSLPWKSNPKEHEQEVEEDYVESPSRPPNRRSQNRLLDDLEAIPPMDEIPGLDSQEAERSSSDASDRRLPPRRQASPKPSSSLTQALKLRSHELSQWFPHFETLRLLQSQLDNLDREGRTILSTSFSAADSETQEQQQAQLTVSDLLRKFPRTAENLRRHRIKVEGIEARYRADAERAQTVGQMGSGWR